MPVALAGRRGGAQRVEERGGGGEVGGLTDTAALHHAQRLPQTAVDPGRGQQLADPVVRLAAGMALRHRRQHLEHRLRPLEEALAIAEAVLPGNRLHLDLRPDVAPHRLRLLDLRGARRVVALEKHLHRLGEARLARLVGALDDGDAGIEKLDAAFGDATEIAHRERHQPHAAPSRARR